MPISSVDIASHTTRTCAWFPPASCQYFTQSIYPLFLPCPNSSLWSTARTLWGLSLHSAYIPNRYCPWFTDLSLLSIMLSQGGIDPPTYTQSFGPFILVFYSCEKFVYFCFVYVYFLVVLEIFLIFIEVCHWGEHSLLPLVWGALTVN